MDEIGDMHPELQTRLLRVLSSQEFYRVGGHRPIKSDVRIIAATNQSIEELIKTSKFREDLYHRLNVFKLELPSLRKRKEDIPALIGYFLKTSASELNTEEKTIDKETTDYLKDFDWPGNIRQLENICRYLTVMSSSTVITMEDLPDDIFREKKVSSAQKWKYLPSGQHIELGIAENNLFIMLAALGLSGPLFGTRLLPIGTLYDPFIARGLDSLNYACYQDARFMLVATPAGITLAPEGGAHQSISSPLIGIGQPGLFSYEPLILLPFLLYQEGQQLPVYQIFLVLIKQDLKHLVY